MREEVLSKEGEIQGKFSGFQLRIRDYFREREREREKKEI